MSFGKITVIIADSRSCTPQGAAEIRFFCLRRVPLCQEDRKGGTNCRESMRGGI